MTSNTSRRSRHRVLVLVAVSLGAASLALSSCTPGSELTAQQSDVVVTIRNPNVDFGAIKTYVMPDTIVHIVAEGEDDNISRKYDEAILDLIAANFGARGYERIDEDPQNPPDALVLVSVTTIDYWYWYSYPPGGWWGWYPGWGWWGGYPGWGYPPPGWGTSYAYTTGTLFVDMVDPEETEDEEVLLYWEGVCNGILSSSESSNVSRFTDSINQMFEQSPYLRSSGQ